MSGFALGLAFDSKSGQMVMVALLLTVGTFYAGTLFGNSDPIYVSELPSNSSSSSPSSFSTGNTSLSLSLSLSLTLMGIFFFLVGLCCWSGKLGSLNSYAWCSWSLD